MFFGFTRLDVTSWCLFFWQVLFLLEPIDEVAVTNLHTFKQKMFVDVSKEGLELGKLIDNIKLQHSLAALVIV
jgi:HSP90 family molecular chaperone